MNKPIKAKDLARLLGLSPSTVSMVLNNKPGISEGTRRLVFDKLAEFHSLPPSPGIQPGAVDFIYFVIFKKHGKVVGDTPFFSQLIEGIEQSCRQSGYNLQIAYINEGDRISSALPLIRARECRGLLLLGTEMAPADAQVFAQIGCPTVLLDSSFSEIALDTIVINNRQAAAHLIENGHTSIGYLHSAFHINNFSERREGFHSALKKNGLEIQPQLEYRLTPTVDGAYSEMKELLASHPKLPTAFFADNDILALAAMRALKEYGCRVPEDISVIGIDDIPMCELTDPPLTTMHVPKHQMGILAVGRLLEKIRQPGSVILTTEIRTSLRKRGSVRRLEA